MNDIDLIYGISENFSERNLVDILRSLIRDGHDDATILVFAAALTFSWLDEEEVYKIYNKMKEE